MPSRFLCDVLDDMRKMYKTRNFSGLLGSIEQAQVMASRMEAALYDQKTIEDYDATASSLNRDLKSKRKELRKLQHAVTNLTHEKTELEEEVKKLGRIQKGLTNGGPLNQIEDINNKGLCKNCGQELDDCVCG